MGCTARIAASNGDRGINSSFCAVHAVQSGSLMAMSIAVVAGDGIGPEVVAEAVRVLRIVGGLDLQELPWGADHYLATGITIPPDGYDVLRSFDAIFVGALGDPRVPDNRHARDILLGTRF